jgi:plastocyanin
MRFALASVVCAAALSTASAQPPKWVAVKGQVVLPKEQEIPVPPNLVVAGVPQCLAKGPLKDEKVLVDPKSRGIKNVVVWLRPADPDFKAKFKPEDIHPADAKRKPQDVVIDQPCCLFTPRVTAARVGDTIVVKNPAPVNHNFFWTSANNGNLNVNIPPGLKHVFAQPLVAEASPIQYKCTVHPWMTGYVRIFDHPYYAVTDADGRFEIKNAPAGAWHIVYWHENVGFLGGKAGLLGTPLAVPPGNTLEMKPTDFNVK